MKYIIRDGQFGYLIKDGRFAELLPPGKYRYLLPMDIDVSITDAYGYVDTMGIPEDVLLSDKTFAEKTATVNLTDGTVAIHSINGRITETITKPGRHIFWNTYEKHEFTVLDMRNPEIGDDIPSDIFLNIPVSQYTKVDVAENHIMLVYLNNKYYKSLTCGKYYFWNYNNKFTYKYYDMMSKLPITDDDIISVDESISDMLISVEIPDTSIALHYIDGRIENVLTTQNRCTYWNTFYKHTFRIVDIMSPEVEEDIPAYVFPLISDKLYVKINVGQGETTLVYFDNKLDRQLGCGTYYFWNYRQEVKYQLFDLKIQQMEVSGQEILTADKVTLRINFTCSYKITDVVKIAESIKDYKMQIYTYIQLILREYVGRYRLDELLNQKDDIAKFVFEKLKEKQSEYCIEFYSSGIKDIILPGEIRDIMNTVLVAEKKAQANVIARREEVASTRSLLNTAKLMDENRTLYRLKEMEYLQTICENVGNISLSGGSDLLTQLTNLMGGAKKE